jgi:hypothetical protein
MPCEVILEENKEKKKKEGQSIYLFSTTLVLVSTSDSTT